MYMYTYYSVDVPPEEGANPVEGAEDRPVSTLGYVLYMCIYLDNS
jgi:hypothetical protein